MEKMDGKGLDFVNLNLEKIKDAFPNCVVDGKVDFEALKLELGELIESSNETYSINWSGKNESKKIAITPSNGTLIPQQDKSVKWDDTKNIYIEGDNLEVLKLLAKTFHNRIKFIYIDPPYNTGGDFIYHDNFNSDLDDYISESGQSFKTNPETSGRYHTDWLNMMYPRLKIARDLLSDDGVIFVSIDDNETNNLGRLLDEIFGSNNRLSTHHIQVRYAQKSLNERSDFQELVENVYIYAKDVSALEDINKPYEDYSVDAFNTEIIETGTPETISIGGKTVHIFKSGSYEIKKHEKGRIGLLKGTWASGSVVKGNASGKYFETYLKPRKEIDGLSVLYKVEGIGEDGLGYRYFTGPQKQDATQGLFYAGVPLFRIEEMKSGESRKYKPIVNFYDFSPDFGNIKHEGGIGFNSGKKPIKMLKQFLNYFQKKDFYVLDFFSGSASTAHAVLDLNSEDGGNRKFIMVQIPENCEEDSEAMKIGAKTICDIGETRIKNAISEIKYKLDKNEAEAGLFSNSVIKSSDLDLGFKVFSLASTNIVPWDGSKQYDESNLLNLNDVFKEGRTKLDVAYEVMLKYGVFDKQLEEKKINGKDVFCVDNDSLVIFLEDEIDMDDVKEIIKLNPTTVVFKEAGFADDNVKMNAEYTLRHYLGEDQIKVLCI